MIYCSGKNLKVPGWLELAFALGWRDIKSWGGRGVRGLAPGEDRHQSVPDYTRDLQALMGAIKARFQEPVVTVVWRTNGDVTARIKWREASSDDGETPAQVLAALVMYFKEHS